MKLWVLFLHNLNHVLRSRLLWMVIAAGFVFQWLGSRLAANIEITFQNSPGFYLDGSDAILIPLYTQVFAGIFLSVIYGIWYAPYPHQGERSLLTHALPVSKWMFPVSYMLNFLMLVLILHVVMLVAFTLSFGLDALTADDFSWAGVVMCLTLLTLAFECMMLLFAVTTMAVGKVAALFIGGGYVAVAMAVDAWLRLAAFVVGGETAWSWRYYFAYLPRFGDLLSGMFRMFRSGEWTPGMISWFLWIAAFLGLFRLLIHHPMRLKTGES